MAIDQGYIVDILALLRRTAGAAALMSLAAAAPAQADDLRIDDAWKAALQDNYGVLSEKQMGMINVIAYSSAAALLCDGIDIDADKVAKATTDVLAAGPQDLNEDEQLQRYTDVILMLGTAKGIMLAEGALHQDVFCTAARAEKDAAGAQSFWK